MPSATLCENYENAESKAPFRTTFPLSAIQRVGNMNNIKNGDRVITWMNETGTVVGPAPRQLQPYQWMVLVDGDKDPCPYLDREITLAEEQE